MTQELSSLRFWQRALLSYARLVADRDFRSTIARGFSSPVQVRRDFFGINVAAGETPAHDDYVIARLRELGILRVRLQFTYSSFGAPTERLLRRMLDDGFDVLLDLVPPFDEALQLESGQGVARWKQFVQEVFSAFSPRVSLFEVGSTSNRARWSGYTYRGYLRMWRIACECAQDIKLAGPNVSDFDPAYNIGLLSWMSRLGRLPDVHTDNLFVERAIESEAFDLRKGGRIAAKILKLDLARKAAVLKGISTRFGIGQTYCTHTCWTSKRLRRWNGDPAPKKADYLVRYLVIAATSGSLDRVYWGPLIGESDGLIDDASGTYPATERVTHYQSIGGRIEGYRPEPAFYALKNVVKQLSGARFLRSASNGICFFEFVRNDGATLHAVWTRDANVVPADLLFHKIGAVFDCEGRSQDRLTTLSERPVILMGAALKIGFEEIGHLVSPCRRARFASVPGMDFLPWQNEAWRGAIAVERGQDAKRRAQTLEPSNLETLVADPLLRDKRNRVWCAQDPLNPAEKWVIKRIRVHGVKRFSYRVRASKAERNWNNAARMLRLGLATPMPVAYFENKHGGSIADSYYVCRYADYLFSARQACVAFRDGFEGFAGVSRDEILDAAARYVHHLHWRGIVHRDLSSGNLLFMRGEGGALNATAIDIGRARFIAGRLLNQRERFRDLMRICYKLDWPNRRALLDRYFRLWGASVPASSAVFLAYYDWKHRIKPMLKRTRAHASQRLRRL